MEILKRIKWTLYLMLPVMMAMSCNNNSGRSNLTETESDSVSKPETVIDIISYTNNAEIDFGQLASRGGANSLVREYAESLYPCRLQPATLQKIQLLGDCLCGQIASDRRNRSSQ
jgi:hypothetical protein